MQAIQAAVCILECEAFFPLTHFSSIWHFKVKIILQTVKFLLCWLLVSHSSMLQIIMTSLFSLFLCLMYTESCREQTPVWNFHNSFLPTVNVHCDQSSVCWFPGLFRPDYSYHSTYGNKISPNQWLVWQRNPFPEKLTDSFCGVAQILQRDFMKEDFHWIKPFKSSNRKLWHTWRTFH